MKKNQQNNRSNEEIIRYIQTNPINLDALSAAPLENSGWPALQHRRRNITPFFIDVNEKITNNGIFNLDVINFYKLVLNIKRFAEFGSSGFTLDTNNNNRYKQIFEAIKKDDINQRLINIEKNPNKDVSIAKLMLSINIVFRTDDNRYFTFPIAAEVLNLSYIYIYDIKKYLYEDYNSNLRAFHKMSFF